MTAGGQRTLARPGAAGRAGPLRWAGLLTLAAMLLVVGAALLAAANPASAAPTSTRPAVAAPPREPIPTPPPTTPAAPSTTPPPSTPTGTPPGVPSSSSAPSTPGATPAPSNAPGTGTPPGGPPGIDPLTPAQWWDPRDWGGVGGNPLNVPKMLWDAIGGLLGGLVGQAAQPLLTLLGKTLLHTPDVANNGPIGELWTKNLALAASLYGLLILGGGVLVMTHETVQTKYAAKDLAPRMFLGLVAAATSMEVMSRMIALSNALAVAILGQGVDGAGLAQQLIAPLFNPSAALYLIVMALVALVLLVGLLLGFVIRVALVMLLAAVAPLALAGHATPFTEGMARVWWRAFIGTLIMQFAQSVTLIVGLRAMYAKGNTVFGVPTADGLSAMLTGIALFWILLKIPGWVGKTVFSGTPITGPRPGSGLIGRVIKTVASAYVLGKLAPSLSRGRGRLGSRLGGRLGRRLARGGGGGGNGPGGGGPRRRPGRGPGPRPGGRGGRPGGGRGGGGQPGPGNPPNRGGPAAQGPSPYWPWGVQGQGQHGQQPAPGGNPGTRQANPGPRAPGTGHPPARATPHVAPAEIPPPRRLPAGPCPDSRPPADALRPDPPHCRPEPGPHARAPRPRAVGLPGRTHPLRAHRAPAAPTPPRTPRPRPAHVPSSAHHHHVPEPTRYPRLPTAPHRRARPRLPAAPRLPKPPAAPGPASTTSSKSPSGAGARPALRDHWSTARRRRPVVRRLPPDCRSRTPIRDNHPPGADP
ncbi:hypothetical protein [Embleya sp. NBC_00896]|uniref:hypothetical protein n=1 Tax=Embleya sp. NBC_00896 TaxID=2975961 RepID=UPI002F90EAF5|nr:hypothetical protein OG928_48420 [Embleya sp. NBC_00896]